MNKAQDAAVPSIMHATDGIEPHLLGMWQLLPAAAGNQDALCPRLASLRHGTLQLSSRQQLALRYSQHLEGQSCCTHVCGPMVAAAAAYLLLGWCLCRLFLPATP